MAFTPQRPASSAKTCLRPARMKRSMALTGGLSMVTTSMSPAIE
jgi:hypothetical protein